MEITVTVEERLAQAETDIAALANSILKMTEVINKYREGQAELTAIVGQLLKKVSTRKE